MSKDRGAPRRARVWVSCSLMGLLVLGCGRGGTKEPESSSEPEGTAAHHKDEPAHEPLPTLIKLAPEVVEAAKIRTAKVAREALVATLSLPGETVADPDRTARVASPVAGRLEQVLFKEGSSVKKGDVLAVIRVPDLGKLRSLAAATEAKARAARANATRLQGLAEKRLASEQMYLDAVAASEALDVEALAARQQLDALGLAAAQSGAPSQLTLRAPLSGTVVSRNAVVGQPITAEEVLADIVDLSEVWFLGRVFEKDLGRLQLDAAAEVQLNAYPGEHFTGKVEYIGRQVDPVARTVTARIRLVNRADLLRVGLFGTAHVALGHAEELERTLVVPRSALTEVAGKQVVFVRHADQDFELHELSLGQDAAGKVQVLAGLRDGEEVVVEGVFSLKSAVLKHTFAEEE
ncbi:MAG: efflux RND transporter periplasmic adaptor subunit [Myxococcales bacterium]